MTDRLSEYLDHLRRNRNTSVHTVAAYGSDLSQFLGFAAGSLGKDVTRLRPTDLELSVIRAFMAELYRRGQSRASVARKLSALRSFVRYLRREGLIETDPASLAVSPRREQRVPAHLSVDEMSRLLEAPDDHEVALQHGPMVRFSNCSMPPDFVSPSSSDWTWRM